MLTRRQVADLLAAHYSRKFEGSVLAGYDSSKRRYRIYGPTLPTYNVDCPYWTLHDFIAPAKARELIACAGHCSR